ncbi:MAG: hypothetical protein WCY34_06585, partial [Candidatus Omnitrophota bacterium]
MKEDKILEVFNKRYSRNPVLRGLIQLIPYSIGSGIDAALIATVISIREDRAKTFFDELDAGKIKLNESLIKSEDFLHKFFVTTKAAFNARRREKIKLFAYLLLSSEESGNFSSIDEYEEYLEVLDEITLRELYILVILDKYVQKYPRASGDNPLQSVVRFWEEFSKEVTDRLQISLDEFNAI